MNELRNKLRDLEIKHKELLKNKMFDEAISLHEQMCEINNLLEKQTDALNAQVPMMMARGFGMN